MAGKPRGIYRSPTRHVKCGGGGGCATARLRGELKRISRGRARRWPRRARGADELGLDGAAPDARDRRHLGHAVGAGLVVAVVVDVDSFDGPAARRGRRLQRRLGEHGRLRPRRVVDHELARRRRRRAGRRLLGRLVERRRLPRRLRDHRRHRRLVERLRRGRRRRRFEQGPRPVGHDEQQAP